VGVIHSCFRCGSEFETVGRVCLACRKDKTPRVPQLGDRLSARELQVVSLVAKGNPNKRIALELHLTEGTVKEYLNRIFRKAGAANRTELAIWYLNEKRVP